MSAISAQLRNIAKKLRAASFSKDRANAIADALPVIEKAAVMLESKPREMPAPKFDPRLARMLAALGRGTAFPGREFYINRPDEFDAAVRDFLLEFSVDNLQ